MNDFNFSSTKEFKSFLNNEKNKKILVICGRQSYKISGASKLIDGFNKIKYSSIFIKNFHIPIW